MPLDAAAPAVAELRLLAEIQRRRECRRSLLAWCETALAPLGQVPAAHHRLLIDELQAVVRGETRRLMINMPPGSAKSTYASVLFPAWLFAQRPGLDVIGASNTADMAKGFSRRVLGLVRDHGATLGYGLARDTAHDWQTTNRGRYRAAGIGGAIAGTRADVALVDDPTRSRADAESEVIRERQWAWFTGDLRTRLKPDAAIIVIMTRWHPDDLGGRLLERQPGLWRVVSLPAVAEGADDALGRRIGEWLWSDDAYGYGGELARVFAEYEAAGAMRDWAALYQQRPRGLEGSLFKVPQIGTVETAPAGGTTVRAWDLAATAQIGTHDPDWTVGLKLQRTAAGQFVVLDVTRLRGGPDEVERAIVNTAAADGRAVRIGLPQDPGQAGKQQVLYLTRKLAGYRVESSAETGDKVTRAAPVAAQVNVGNLAVLPSAWGAAFRGELADFPSGRHDDQVDALSRAFAMLIAPPAPARFAQIPIIGR